MDARGRHDDLIRGVAMKICRQNGALEGDLWRQRNQTYAGFSECFIEPVVD